jgi:hypothetical protein
VLGNPARGAVMLIGSRVTTGALSPDDFGLMYCWANDVGNIAARLLR